MPILNIYGTRFMMRSIILNFFGMRYMGGVPSIGYSGGEGAQRLPLTIIYSLTNIHFTPYIYTFSLTPYTFYIHIYTTSPLTHIRPAFILILTIPSLTSMRPSLSQFLLLLLFILYLNLYNLRSYSRNSDYYK